MLWYTVFLFVLVQCKISKLTTVNASSQHLGAAKQNFHSAPAVCSGIVVIVIFVVLLDI